MANTDLSMQLLFLLEREGAISIPQTARTLGASEEEVWDALEELVFSYDAIGVRMELGENFATLRDGESKRVLRLTRQEVTALIDMLESAGYTDDDELVSSLLAARGALGEEEPDARVRAVAEPNSPELLELVAQACEDEHHSLLHMGYRSENGKQSERNVEPYRVSSSGQFRYLIAWCHTACAWRAFRLDRIESAQALDATFTPRDGVPTIDDLLHGDIIYTHVRFAAGTPVPEWPGITRKYTELDGSVTARVSWTGGDWLPKHIVACLGAARPLDPPELVAACRSYAESLLEG